MRTSTNIYQFRVFYFWICIGAKSQALVGLSFNAPLQLLSMEAVSVAQMGSYLWSYETSIELWSPAPQVLLFQCTANQSPVQFVLVSRFPKWREKPIFYHVFQNIFIHHKHQTEFQMVVVQNVVTHLFAINDNCFLVSYCTAEATILRLYINVLQEFNIHMLKYEWHLQSP